MERQASTSRNVSLFWENEKRWSRQTAESSIGLKERSKKHDF
jgi:hypothetical protein